MIIYDFDFRLYQRHFRQPLKTHHGSWNIREGIILRLGDETGKIGWGEIAPLPWFGSETLAQALEFCQQLGGRVVKEEIAGISEDLHACKFGFESALEELSRAKMPRRKREKGRIDYCYLLPTGAAALQAWRKVWQGKVASPATFKWKIGVDFFAEEMKLFQKLIQELPSQAKLRLDANGGLSLEEAKAWLETTDKSGMVEFIEQPLSPQEFEQMLALSRDYSTPLALDESVATVKQLEECYQKGWRGVFVIKAAIAGSPARLRHFCNNNKIDTVFSSVFETAIAREAVLDLAAELANPHRALGFGVNDWFFEAESNWLEMLWKTS